MSWVLRHPTVPAHHLHELIEADDALIAVGDLGTIFKSRDGLNWTVTLQDSAERINAAAFGGGKHVAFGDQGSWWTSVNAESWIRKAPFTPTNIVDAAFGNGRFVVLTVDNQLFSSADGEAWAHRETLAPTQFNYPRRVRFLNGKFFAIHEQTLLTSSDAVTWSQTSLVLPDRHQIMDLSFGNGTYVLGVSEPFTFMKRVWTSTDGQDWTGDFDIGAPFALQTLFFGNGSFVALGEAGALGRSADGATWEFTPDPQRFYWNAGLFWKGAFYAVGLPALVARSTDAITWERVNPTLSQGLSDVICASIGCVTASEGGVVLFSKDGKEWKKISVSSSVPFYSSLKLAYGAGVFVAAGPGGLIFSSHDGENWEQRESTVTKDLGFVCFGNGAFLAGGPQRVMIDSKDGITWNKFTPTGLDNNVALSQVIHANGRFMAVGNQISFEPTPGFVAASTNGTNWTRTNIRVNYLFRGLAFGDDTFVAVGTELNPNGFANSQLLLTSTNGTTWIKKTNASQDGGSLNGITFFNGQFLAIGSEPGLFSDDGMSWQPLWTGYNLSAITPFNETTLAVGANGVIIQSESLARPRPRIQEIRIESQSVILKWSGAPGTSFTLQFQETLGPIWQDVLQNVEFDGSSYSVTDTRPRLEPQRFYRIKSL